MRGIALAIILAGCSIATSIRREKIADLDGTDIAMRLLMLVATFACIIMGW